MTNFHDPVFAVIEDDGKRSRRTLGGLQRGSRPGGSVHIVDLPVRSRCGSRTALRAAIRKIPLERSVGRGSYNPVVLTGDIALSARPDAEQRRIPCRARIDLRDLSDERRRLTDGKLAVTYIVFARCNRRGRRGPLRRRESRLFIPCGRDDRVVQFINLALRAADGADLLSVLVFKRMLDRYLIRTRNGNGYILIQLTCRSNDNCIRSRNVFLICGTVDLILFCRQRLDFSVFVRNLYDKAFGGEILSFQERRLRAAYRDAADTARVTFRTGEQKQ